MPSFRQDLRGFIFHWVLGIALVVVGFLGMFAMMYLFMAPDRAGNWAETSAPWKLLTTVLVLAPLALSFAGLRRIRKSHNEEEH